MPAFNRNAAAKFKELAPEAKHRYHELATVEEGEELTENQKARRVSSIFTKLRDHTVSLLTSIYIVINLLKYSIIISTQSKFSARNYKIMVATP